MASLPFVEQVYDNIHGYIPLTELELEIMRAPVFQRLRHVKQLGLVNMVFPGAEHSRFAHSLGVMHIVHVISQGLEPALTPEQQQVLRVGALLHDVGHFPLSHALEEVLSELEEEQDRNAKAHWAGTWATALGATEVQETPSMARDTKLHEFLGQTIIQETSIADILDAKKVSPYVVAAVAMGTTAELEGSDVKDPVLNVMSQMLHSQVDADRLDYLLRDSSFSGVEAGGFDRPKLYKEACWGEGTYGFRVSGLRSVEQFLMARLTNYRRVVFNKHVQSFEEMAKAMYRDLVRANAMPEFSEILEMVQKDSAMWVAFNDHFFMHMTSQFARKAPNDLIRRRAERILNGQPMVEVMVEERFCTRKEWGEYKAGDSRLPLNDEAKIELAKKAGVDPDELTLKEAGVKVIDDPGVQPVFIMDSNGLFKDILELPESIMSSFGGKRVWVRRLYALDEEAARKVQAVL